MENFIEIIGYAAAFFVLISFIMKKMLYLRVINIAGSGLFIWYGAMLDSTPIMVINVALILINVFYILKIISENKAEAVETNE